MAKQKSIRGIDGEKVESALEIDHKGKTVLEIISYVVKDNTNKLTWIQVPPDQLKIGGKDNNLFSVDYGVIDETNLTLARRSVRIAFDGYWGLPPDAEKPVPDAVRAGDGKQTLPLPKPEPPGFDPRKVEKKPAPTTKE